MTTENYMNLIQEEKIEGKVLLAKVKGSDLIYRYRIPLKDQITIDDIKTVLFLDTKHAADYKEYYFDVKIIKKKKTEILCESVFPLEEIAFIPLNWEIRAEIRIGQEKKRMLLVNRSYINYFKYCSLLFENSYQYQDGNFVYPYVNGARKIVLQYRQRGEYDDYRIKLKERLALARFVLTYPVLKKKKILLVYEKYSQMAQDNGYFFFKYCMDHHMEEKMGYHIFYVITKDAADREKLLPYKDHILDFMSIRHITYALGAKLLVSTDAKAHVYPWRRKGSMLIPFIKRKPLVFLQHGVTAMKKVDFFYGKKKPGECNMFIVTSDFEQDLVVKYFGYSKEQVPVTGFARWDVLEDHSENSNEILVMPTWRSWLEDQSKEDFKKSKYYQYYQSLLTNQRFYDLLKKYNLKANFYLHTKFKEYVSEFVSDSEHIRIIPFGEEPLNEVMMRCRMLITDYSSVSWDMFYQEKPVLFFQFDLDDYLEAHGSYIDMRKELFGPVFYEEEKLLNGLEACAASGFALTDLQKEQHAYYYKYIDDKNSMRICESIMNYFR